MSFELTILGSNSAVPAFGRHPSSQVLSLDGNKFLIDCGEGCQLQMSRYNIKRGKLDHIFISHLHGDHYFGLFGLINTLNLNGRQAGRGSAGPPPRPAGRPSGRPIDISLDFGDSDDGPYFQTDPDPPATR